MQASPRDISAAGTLGMTTLERRYVQPRRDNIAVIDLERLRFVTPYGLVALAVHAESQSSLGRRTQVISPREASVANYVSRMRLGAVVEEMDGMHDLPRVGARATGELAELRTLASHEDSDSLAAMVFDKVESVDEALAVALQQSIAEMGQNVPDHAGCPGYFAAQSTYGGTRVEFAIADAGFGLRETLGGGIATHEQALGAVMEGGATRTGRASRGQGYTTARDKLTSSGGEFFAQTGSAWRLELPDGRSRRGTHTDQPFPGTAVAGRVRC